MDSFVYSDGSLHCEGVRLSEIVDAVGTPVYVYSTETLLGHYHRIAEAFAELSPTICFSIKSLANVHILRLLSQAGSGFDVVSGGELMRARSAGADMSKVVFAGVGKTDDEIRQALKAGIGCFNVECAAELENLSALAAELETTARAALRVNPDVYDVRTHSYTTTGKKETKFGLDIDKAADFFQTYSQDANVTLDAIHFHLGSPIYSAEPYVRAIERILALIDDLGRRHIAIRALNIGGGYAADYESGASPSAAEYAEQIVPLLRGSKLEIFIEPGRQIACNAGVLLTKVLYLKQGGSKTFVIVDAAMTDLIRPALYDSKHFIYPLRLSVGEAPPQRGLDYAPANGVTVDVVGGVCESSDFLCKDRLLPPVSRGDHLVVFSAGAYGFVMSSQYNSRCRAAEVLVEGDLWRTIRRRETYADLILPEEQT